MFKLFMNFNSNMAADKHSIPSLISELSCIFKERLLKFENLNKVFANNFTFK